MRSLIGTQYIVTKSTEVPDAVFDQVKRDATQRALWAWNDIMVAFKEIGYDPTQNEKERIINSIAIKKATSMLQKMGY